MAIRDLVTLSDLWRVCNRNMYLGIDIGTSSVKAVVIDGAGVVQGHSAAPLCISRPHPLWSEQDPNEWWEATDQAVKTLPAQLRGAVRAIGLSGQMHGATLLDGEDRPLRPAMLWNDGRATEECHELEERVPNARNISGNLAMPGFTAPKVLWVARHERELFERTRTVLLPKDFIRLLLTGEKYSDMSDASGTYWMDVSARQWSDALLAGTGLTRDQMPRLVEGADQTGELRAQVAADWGIHRVPVAGGAGDNAAGALGVGAVASGDAILSLGTSGVIFVVTDTLRANPSQAVHAFCHCLPALWHQMAVHLSAAVCIEWGAKLIGLDGPMSLLREAERAQPGPEIFLPYLSGERTPHNDPLVRGAFLQLSHDTTRERLAYAVLEGVAFALADGLTAIQATGTRVSRLSVIGGGALSPFWAKILAASLDVELQYVAGGEHGAALGAARLARLMRGREPLATVCRSPSVERSIQPDSALRVRLLARRSDFQQAYRRLSPRYQP